MHHQHHHQDYDPTQQPSSRLVHNKVFRLPPPIKNQLQSRHAALAPPSLPPWLVSSHGRVGGRPVPPDLDHVVVSRRCQHVLVLAVPPHAVHVRLVRRCLVHVTHQRRPLGLAAPLPLHEDADRVISPPCTKQHSRGQSASMLHVTTAPHANLPSPVVRPHLTRCRTPTSQCCRPWPCDSPTAVAPPSTSHPGCQPTTTTHAPSVSRHPPQAACRGPHACLPAFDHSPLPDDDGGVVTARHHLVARRAERQAPHLHTHIHTETEKGESMNASIKPTIAYGLLKARDWLAGSVADS